MTGCNYKPWDIVTLKGCSDYYRVYTCPWGRGLIFVGVNSDTVRHESTEIVDRVHNAKADGIDVGDSAESLVETKETP